jgi:DNA-directed RNA polymerase subunit H (RpoH/RPB5)
MFNIYNNLLTLAEKSHIKLDSGKYNKLSETEFNTYMKNLEFIVITGDKTYKYGKMPLDTDIKQYIILVAPQSDYGKKFPKIKDLLKKTVGSDTVGQANLKLTSEILIVVEEKPSASIERKILEMKNDENGPYIHIHDYTKFKINIFKSVLVPEQEIADEKEVKAITEETYSNKSNFAKMKPHDAVSVWLGAKIGHVIKVKRISEVGYTYYYRIVM